MWNPERKDHFVDLTFYGDVYKPIMSRLLSSLAYEASLGCFSQVSLLLKEASEILSNRALFSSDIKEKFDVIWKNAQYPDMSGQGVLTAMFWFQVSRLV